MRKGYSRVSRAHNAWPRAPCICSRLPSSMARGRGNCYLTYSFDVEDLKGSSIISENVFQTEMSPTPFHPHHRQADEPLPLIDRATVRKQGRRALRQQAHVAMIPSKRVVLVLSFLLSIGVVNAWHAWPLAVRSPVRAGTAPQRSPSGSGARWAAAGAAGSSKSR